MLVNKAEIDLEKLVIKGYTNAGTALFATAIAYLSTTVLEVRRPWLVISIIFPMTTLSYALDRFLDPKPGSHKEVPWTTFFCSALGWCVACLQSIRLGHTAAVVHSLVFPISVFAYTYPIFNFSWEGVPIRRIKDVPALKPIFVGFMWTQLVVCSWYYSPQRNLLPLTMTVSWVGLKLIINVIACDLVDIGEDRAKGVQTWPVMLGFHETLAWLRALNFISCIPTIIALSLRMVPLSCIWLESLSAFWGICMACIEPNTPSLPFKAVFDLGSGVILLIATSAIRR